MLDADASGGLDRLKKRFGASNALASVRNNYAFHHPTTQQMEAAYQSVVSKDSEELDWSVRFNKALLNTFFFVSDYVLIHAMTDTLRETDVNVAHEKLLRDLAPIANDLSQFSFGFAKAIFQKYINSKELVMTIVAQVADAPNIDDVRFPLLRRNARLAECLSSYRSPNCPRSARARIRIETQSSRAWHRITRGSPWSDKNSQVPTLADLRKHSAWAWVYCERCLHRAPVAFVPLMIRWGRNASSGRVRIGCIKVAQRLESPMRYDIACFLMTARRDVT